MQIRILFFGSLAHDVGVDKCELELSDNATVRDALQALTESYGTISRHAQALATAVNLEYVGAGHILVDQDELALIPPVSGG